MKGITAGRIKGNIWVQVAADIRNHLPDDYSDLFWREFYNPVDAVLRPVLEGTIEGVSNETNN